MRTTEWVVSAVAVLALLSMSAGADTLKLELSELSDGAVPPQGTAPWLTACFEDMGGYVELTMSAIGLVGTEYVSDWHFNLNPDLDPDDLSFEYKLGVAVDPDDVDDVGAGENAFKAGGDGDFDILFGFPTTGKDGGAYRFTGGRTSVYWITLDDDDHVLTAADFAYLEVGHNPGLGSGPHYSVAHVQSIGTGTSAWIGATGTGTCDPVPEPASMTLLGLGLAGLGFRRFRKRG